MRNSSVTLFCNNSALAHSLASCMNLKANQTQRDSTQMVTCNRQAMTTTMLVLLVGLRDRTQQVKLSDASEASVMVILYVLG